MTNHSRLIWCILVILAGFCLYLLLGNGQHNTPNRPPEVNTLVKTSIVKAAPMARTIDALGNALAYDSTRIISASDDYLVELNIKEGQQVRRGELIARLNDAEERAEIAELTATLTEQKRQLARLKNLTQTQSSAQSLLDEQQAKVNATLARLEALNARLSELEIHAPFDGLLGLRQVSQGAYLKSGTELTTLDDISKIRVEFSVPERFLAELTTGMPVKARNVAYQQTDFVGTVSALDPRVDPVTRSVRVHAVINNQDLRLRPGMLLTIQVQLAEAEVIQIAEKAVTPLQSKHFVFVVGAGDKVQQLEIVPGQRLPGVVEVVSGLKAGDEIVTEGSQKLRSGAVISRLEG